MKQALLKIHIAVFLWGFTGVLGRLITLNEAWLVWYRLLITIVSLAFLAFMLKRTEFLAFSKKSYKLLGIGFIVGLHWLFFYGSIKYANVSVALVCLSSNAFFTALLEPAIQKQNINGYNIILGLMGIVGIGLIFHFDPQFQKGIMWGLISSFFTALFSTLNKKIVHRQAAENLMFWELLGAFIFMCAVLFFYGNPLSNFQIPNLNNWFWLLILSWLCTIVAMFLSLQALQKISAFTQNLTLNLEPVYGIILAFAVYKEHTQMHPTFFLGFIIIMLSVLLQMKRVVNKKTT
jgi:drug/metabolite transporter (DMT)-like permease